MRLGEQHLGVQMWTWSMRRCRAALRWSVRACRQGQRSELSSAHPDGRRGARSSCYCARGRGQCACPFVTCTVCRRWRWSCRESIARRRPDQRPEAGQCWLRVKVGGWGSSPTRTAHSAHSNAPMQGQLSWARTVGAAQTDAISSMRQSCGEHRSAPCGGFVRRATFVRPCWPPEPVLFMPFTSGEWVWRRAEFEDVYPPNRMR